MNPCGESDVAGMAAFSFLWHTRYAGKEIEDAYTKTVLDIKGDPELKYFSEQLQGLRVLVTDDPKVTSLNLGGLVKISVAGTVDVAIYYKYSARNRIPGGLLDLVLPSIPDGVKYVAFIDSEMTELPKLPDSVRVVIVQDCPNLRTVSTLPSKVESFTLMKTEPSRKPLPEVTLVLPGGLRSLYVEEIDSVYIKGSMPMCLTVASFIRVGGVRADVPMPMYLKLVDHIAPDTGVYKPSLSLTVSEYLQSLFTHNSAFLVEGTPVTTIEEYWAVAKKINPDFKPIPGPAPVSIESVSEKMTVEEAADAEEAALVEAEKAAAEKAEKAAAEKAAVEEIPVEEIPVEELSEKEAKKAKRRAAKRLARTRT